MSREVVAFILSVITLVSVTSWGTWMLVYSKRLLTELRDAERQRDIARTDRDWLQGQVNAMTAQITRLEDGDSNDPLDVAKGVRDVLRRIGSVLG